MAPRPSFSPLSHPSAQRLHRLTLILTCLLALVLVLPALAVAEDADIGELYQFNCTSCHGAEVYTRTDRKVTSPEALERQVRRCETALSLKWFDDDIIALADYLNTHYYKFTP